MRITIKLKPNSNKGPLIETHDDGSLIVYIREIAAENKANDALIKLLSEHYNVPKTQIEIVRGRTSRHKIIEIN